MSLVYLERLVDRLTPAYFLAPVLALAVASLASLAG